MKMSGIKIQNISRLLRPYTPPSWAKVISPIPLYKVELANKNTPIHQWNLPGLPSGFKVGIKRDDMTGSTLTGNKVRKLEFLMAEALQNNCKHVITCGGIQSNHCRAVAVCSRQLGLVPHLILRGDQNSVEELGCDGNVLLDRLCGANIYLVPRKSPYLTHIVPRMEILVQKIKQSTGESSYMIPVGGSNRVGIFGYLSVFEELMSQGVLEDYDDIVFACGSGGTAAGLCLGNYLTGSKLRIHAVAVSDDAAYFHDHVTGTLREVGIQEVTSEEILNVVEGHKGQGYGISTQEELDFILEVSQSTGIMLDPVYTGKAVKGMVYEIQNNPSRYKGNRILFIHTGGVYGLFDGRINSLLSQRGAKHNQVHMWEEADKPPV
ncbi:hypothetical protein ACJMK2_017718 [Sinanodonta woodiana]|uniref:Tryptophan synthase beta chain-like PALP domain-containing protein n=1 Tax=Sinanodonta woodiana TaxID=1069815 RepID=A0ABD3UER9_SINWO